MPKALETPWVTIEVNDIPLSLCDDQSRPNLRMISWSNFFFFFNHLLNLLSEGRKASNPTGECIYHD